MSQELDVLVPGKKHGFIQGARRVLVILCILSWTFHLIFIELFSTYFCVFSDDVNLEPLLPDVAKELGWKDMKSVAVHSGIAMAVIESCKRDYPNDTEEQTLQLLRRWVEKEDGDAANKLIRILKNKDKKCKAENISYMLSKVNSAGNSWAVYTIKMEL